MKIIDLSNMSGQNLVGGREQIIRKGRYVVRPGSQHSEQLQQFLTLLPRCGFHQAPAFYGVDQQGNEVLEYIKGEVYNYPLPLVMQSEAILLSLAAMMQQFHAASAHCFNRCPVF